MEHTIFKSFGAMTLQEMEEMEKSAREQLQELGIEEPTNNEIMDEVYHQEELWYGDEQLNLDREVEGRIIAIADIGTWRGRRSGYKLCGSRLNEVLALYKCDSISVSCNNYTIYADLYHHDGVNHVEYRELREDTNYEVLLDALYSQKPVSREMIRKYTKSLRPYIKEVYGF